MEDVTINEPKRLIFVLPAAVTDGLWRVSVSTQYGSGRTTVKNLRTYELDEPLAVGSAAQEGGGSGGGSGSGGEGGLEEDPLG